MFGYHRVGFNFSQFMLKTYSQEWCQKHVTQLWQFSHIYILISYYIVDISWKMYDTCIMTLWQDHGLPCQSCIFWCNIVRFKGNKIQLIGYFKSLGNSVADGVSTSVGLILNCAKKYLMLESLYRTPVCTKLSQVIYSWFWPGTFVIKVLLASILSRI